MPERVPCEFFLIRYVPDAVKGEFTNIGVLLREAAPPQPARVRFTRDWTRVRCLDADADIGLLEALEGEIDARLRSGPGSSSATGKSVIAMIEDTFSNSIQMTELRACLAENPAAELDLLMQLYVEPLRVKHEPKRTGRAAIAGAMRTHFERAGVWALMRKRIAVSMYTQPGDPMKIDCGYRPNSGVPGELVRGDGNGVVKMFHAVSLKADVEAAKVLAYSAPRLYQGVARIEGAKLELTAVVEPLRAVLSDNVDVGTDADEDVQRYRFGVESMEAADIRVLTISDLARAAETARIDLRV
jgi:hypothetical protein